MPIHAEIILDGGTYKQLEIVPGSSYSVRNCDETSPKLLSVHCNFNDSGGIIYTDEPVAFNATPSPLKLRLLGRDDETIETVIGEGQSYEKEIRIYAGPARLILQHYTEAS